MNNLKLAKEIYGGCKVYSQSGKLMFRCNQKRLEWYLKRNIAIRVEGEDNAIQLTFKAKGEGDPEDVLKVERLNHCVVCGEKDLSKLTKHHVVPDEFRSNFPDKYKSSLSILLVVMCRSCHDHYENNFARVIKNSLFATIDLKEIHSFNNLIRYMNHLSIAMKQEDFPSHKIDYLKKVLKNLKSPPELDLKQIEDRNVSYVENWLKNIGPRKTPGGEVCKTITNYEEFSIMWFNDFMNNAKPQYASSNLTETAVRKAIEYISSK